MARRKQKSLSISKNIRFWQQWTEIQERQVHIAKELGLSTSTVSTVVGNGKASEANTGLVSNSKTKKAQGVKQADLDTETVSWFKQHHSYIRVATKVFLLEGMCSARKQF